MTLEDAQKGPPPQGEGGLPNLLVFIADFPSVHGKAIVTDVLYSPNRWSKVFRLHSSRVLSR